MNFKKLLTYVHENSGLEIKDCFNLTLFLLVGRWKNLSETFSKMGVVDYYDFTKNPKLHAILKPYFNDGSVPEYLLGSGISKLYMEMYQDNFTNSGNKNAQFFTPECIAENIFDLIDDGREYPFVADFAAGTGSLFSGVTKKFSGKSGNEVYFAHQDIDRNVNLLCELQLKLNGFTPHYSFEGDILNSYSETLGQERAEFDYILINPPFGLDAKITNQKFFNGLDIPKKESEWAFVLAALDLLKSDGKCAAILPLGSLFRESGTKIRQHIIKNIQTVVTLPNKLFLNTDIPCCIVILTKKENNCTHFIDASGDFVVDGKRNKWVPTRVKSVLGAPHNIDNYSCVKKVDGSNLTPSRYIKNSKVTTKHNIIEINAQLADLKVKTDKSKQVMDGIWEQVLKLK